MSKKMEIAMKQVSDKYQFKVRWLPFFLDPTLPKKGLDKRQHYRKKFGARFEAMEPHMRDVGDSLGIKFSYGGKLSNTLDSHRLISFAEKHGKQDEVVNVLFRSYFEEEKDIGDESTLLSAAEEAGLDLEQVREMLRSDALKREVTEEVEGIHAKYGVSGVPFFIFNEKYAFSGAQDPETFVSVFQKIASL